MRKLPQIETLLDAAQHSRRCATHLTDAQRRSFKRRVASDELLSPYRGIYIRTEYWESLTPIERTLHVVRTLQQRHPDWVFAGTTAACAYNYDHSFSLHGELPIYIASPRTDSTGDCKQLRRIRMNPISYTLAGQIKVTSVSRTLLDCGLNLNFQQALPIFDSAARNGINVHSALDLCHQLHLDSARISSLCAYTNALSENGGESTLRAAIIDLGYVVPQLQCRFDNPANPNAPLRADFIWKLPQGKVIVAEYDGMEKYVMNDKMDRKTIQSKVLAERQREDVLRAQGVTLIIRLDYDDIIHPRQLDRKLNAAGIPKRQCLADDTNVLIG